MYFGISQFSPGLSIPPEADSLRDTADRTMVNISVKF
jgi:hypothetical protein